MSDIRRHADTQTRSSSVAQLPMNDTRSTMRDVVQLLRPAQWLKNVVVFAGPAAAKQLFHADALLHCSVAFVCFCLVSSSVYAINDTVDREADARHPIKRHRPVASGAISPRTALMLSASLLAGAILMATLFLNRGVVLILGLYFLMVLAYSLVLKHQILLDVIVIALGFVLRAWAGSQAVGVATSEWLVACMFTLCMFLGFGKRRCEIAMLGTEEDARGHRPTLVRYTPDLLNHLITVSAGITLITFLLYTMDRSRPVDFDKQQMFYTLPIVCYGIFRYAMITELGVHAGPTEIIMKDRGMRWSILVWAIVAMTIVYRKELWAGLGG